MEKILVIAPPTIDLVEGEPRPGGPGLYAGLALSILGAKPTLAGPIGVETLPAVAAERRLGLERVGYPTTRPGAVFSLTYRGQERRVETIHRPPPIDHGEILKTLTRASWDMILLSPLSGEEAGHLLPLLWQYTGLVVVDAQGYHRVGLKKVLDAPGLYQVLHASGQEASGLGHWGVLVETNGPGKIRLATPWASWMLDPEGPRLADPTGAGDVFTAALALGLLRGYSLPEAARKAAALVPVLLPRIQEAIKKWQDAAQRWSS